MTSVLSSSDLAYMRSAIAELLPDTCNILSATEVADGYGGVTQTWGTTSASVACRADIKSGMESLNGASLRPYRQLVFSMPYNTTINASNRIEYGSDVYTVQSVNTEQSWIAVKRVQAELTDAD